MNSLPDGFHALVVGASGAIGAAFVDVLGATPRCASVRALHRHSTPPLDFADEDSIAQAARVLADGPRYHLIINAAGLLHGADLMPEKRLADLHYAQLLATFQANAFGPALLMRHFVPLLAKERAIVAMLSAKVGSIGDNRLGGWYSYRASKAALNMLVRTAAIEVARSPKGRGAGSAAPGNGRFKPVAALPRRQHRTPGAGRRRRSAARARCAHACRQWQLPVLGRQRITLVA